MTTQNPQKNPSLQPAKMPRKSQQCQIEIDPPKDVAVVVPASDDTPQGFNVTEDDESAADVAETNARKAFVAQCLTASNVDTTSIDLKTPVSSHVQDASHSFHGVDAVVCALPCASFAAVPWAVECK